MKRFVIVSMLILLAPAAALADEPAAAKPEKKSIVFNAWASYGASTVSHESEPDDMSTDDFSLGSEIGWRLLGDLAIVASFQVSAYHFIDGADLPARGGWSAGLGLAWAGPVRVSVGVEGGVHSGYPWDVETISDLENESFFVVAEFARVHVPLMPIGNYRLGVMGQVQARQFGDETTSTSAMVGVVVTD